MSIETKCCSLLGAVKCSPGVGRKRVAIRDNDDGLSDVVGSRSDVPVKRGRAEGENSVLESLPQDILIKILCGVDHDDLDQLVRVSTAVRVATLIAKSSHFAYKTPRKTCKGKASVEPPKAPKRRSRFSEKNFENVAVHLFA